MHRGVGRDWGCMRLPKSWSCLKGIKGCVDGIHCMVVAGVIHEGLCLSPRHQSVTNITDFTGEKHTMDSGKIVASHFEI